MTCGIIWYRVWQAIKASIAEKSKEKDEVERLHAFQDLDVFSHRGVAH